MSTETFQTKYPDGLTVHLDADCLRLVDNAFFFCEDDFDGKFRFIAEDAIRSLLGAIKEAEQSRAYDNYVTAREQYTEADTQHITAAISTKSSAASIIPNDHDRICHCNTCGVDR